MGAQWGALGRPPSFPSEFRPIPGEYGRNETQPVFVGVHERQLDDRGRVALPPTFRHPLGDLCYLFSGEDGCVSIRSVEAFKDEAGDLIARVKRGDASRDRQRAFAASASEASIDKQGRVTISPELRAFAGIEPQSAIVLLGDLDHIEIWEPAAYATHRDIGSNELTGDAS
jgi:MraZ protein